MEWDYCFLQKIECDYYFPQKMVKNYVDDFVEKMHNFLYSMINWNWNKVNFL